MTISKASWTGSGDHLTSRSMHNNQPLLGIVYWYYWVYHIFSITWNTSRVELNFASFAFCSATNSLAKCSRQCSSKLAETKQNNTFTVLDGSKLLGDHSTQQVVKALWTYNWLATSFNHLRIGMITPAQIRGETSNSKIKVFLARIYMNLHGSWVRLSKP